MYRYRVVPNNTGVSPVPNKYRYPRYCDRRHTKTQCYFAGRTERTDVQGTGIRVVPRQPMCQVPVLIWHLTVTNEVSATGSEAVPNLTVESGAHSQAAPKILSTYMMHAHASLSNFRSTATKNRRRRRRRRKLQCRGRRLKKVAGDNSGSTAAASCNTGINIETNSGGATAASASNLNVGPLLTCALLYSPRREPPRRDIRFISAKHSNTKKRLSGVANLEPCCCCKGKANSNEIRERCEHCITRVLSSILTLRHQICPEHHETQTRRRLEVDRLEFTTCSVINSILRPLGCCVEFTT